MKIICPYCKHVYPNISNKYQGMVLECSECHQEFVAEKVMEAWEAAKIRAEQRAKKEKNKKVVGCIVKLCILAVIIWGGWKGYCYYQQKKLEEKQKAVEAEKKLALEREQQFLQRLKDIVVDAQNHLLGAGPRSFYGQAEKNVGPAPKSKKRSEWLKWRAMVQKEENALRKKMLDMRLKNSGDFLQRINAVLEEAGSKKLDEDFIYDFQWLTVYTNGDANDTIKLMKLKDGWMKAATIDDFLKAANSNALSKDDKKRIIVSYWYGKECSIEKGLGKLCKTMAAVQHNQYVAKQKMMTEYSEYLNSQIKKMQDAAFEKVRWQLSGEFKNFEDVMTSMFSTEKDKQVLQGELKKESIYCSDFEMQKYYSYNEISTLYEANKKTLKTMEFKLENKKILSGIYLFSLAEEVEKNK